MSEGAKQVIRLAKRDLAAAARDSSEEPVTVEIMAAAGWFPPQWAIELGRSLQPGDTVVIDALVQPGGQLDPQQALLRLERPPRCATIPIPRGLVVGFGTGYARTAAKDLLRKLGGGR